MLRPNTVTREADNDVTEMVLPSSVDTSNDFDDTLPQGTLLGEYVVDRVVGRGGGGVVYAATPLSSSSGLPGRSVAIKVLRTEMACYPSMITRFLREAREQHGLSLHDVRRQLERQIRGAEPEAAELFTGEGERERDELAAFIDRMELEAAKFEESKARYLERAAAKAQRTSAKVSRPVGV